MMAYCALWNMEHIHRLSIVQVLLTYKLSFDNRCIQSSSANKNF